MANTLESNLRSIIARATSEITASVRAEIAARITGVVAPAAAPKRRGRPAKAPAAPAATTAGPAKAKTAGEKRRRGWNEADVEKTLAHIRSAPGQRSEQIAKALGFDGKRMFKVLARLRETNRVSVKGYGRGGAYSAA